MVTSNGTDELRRVDYIYDESGSVYGFSVNGKQYYYRKNLQGDVIGILDKSGTLLVSYAYTAYGVPTTSYPGAENATSEAAKQEIYILGSNNPFRYRSYYFDTETGFYYLGSRYYDPVTGRFLNADGYASTGQGVLAQNMFAYCANNPVNLVDPSGNCYYGLGGVWAHDNWEYIGGYKRKPDPRIAEKKELLTDLGFQNITDSSAAEYLYTTQINGIDTVEEEAHFLAQCAIETEFGIWLTEIGNNEYFLSKPYGYKYRGAGYIQLTWDYNYEKFATYMNNDLIYTMGADYVAEHYAWRAAGWFWSNNNINEVISSGGSVRNVTRIVNGGYARLVDKEKCYYLAIEKLRR